MTEPEAENTTSPEGDESSPQDVVAGEPDAQEPDAPDDDAPEPEPSPNSEAAKYRVQLREAEAQRDALSERLTPYLRKECEAAVADLLELGSDLWDVGGYDAADFYQDGKLDADMLRLAAGTLAEQRPRLAKPKGPRYQNFGQGLKPPPQRGGGWSDVLQQ